MRSDDSHSPASCKLFVLAVAWLCRLTVHQMPFSCHSKCELSIYLIVLIMCGVRIYAGRAAGSWNDLHALEVSTLLWTDLTDSLTGVSPGPSYYASLLPAGDRVYLFGGLLSGGTGVRPGPSLVAMTFRLPLPLNTAHNAQALSTGHFLQLIDLDTVNPAKSHHAQRKTLV